MRPYVTVTARFLVATPDRLPRFAPRTATGTERSTMSKLRPLHDRVVIRRSEEEKKTAGGIVLPGSAAEKANHGVILAAGPGKTLENGEVRALAVKVGDKVVFGPYSGSNTVKIDGEDLLVMAENEILAVLEG
eukprot:gene6151-7120_t